MGVSNLKKSIRNRSKTIFKKTNMLRWNTDDISSALVAGVIARNCRLRRRISWWQSLIGTFYVWIRRASVLRDRVYSLSCTPLCEAIAWPIQLPSPRKRFPSLQHCFYTFHQSNWLPRTSINSNSLNSSNFYRLPVIPTIPIIAYHGCHPTTAVVRMGALGY